MGGWESNDLGCIKCVLLLMAEIRRSPVEVGSLSHYLQGFIHPRWCKISSIILSCISLHTRSTWGCLTGFTWTQTCWPCAYCGEYLDETGVQRVFFFSGGSFMHTTGEKSCYITILRNFVWIIGDQANSNNYLILDLFGWDSKVRSWFWCFFPHPKVTQAHWQHS